MGFLNHQQYGGKTVISTYPIHEASPPITKRPLPMRFPSVSVISELMTRSRFLRKKIHQFDLLDLLRPPISHAASLLPTPSPAPLAALIAALKEITSPPDSVCPKEICQEFMGILKDTTPQLLTKFLGNHLSISGGKFWHLGSSPTRWCLCLSDTWWMDGPPIYRS